MAPDPATDARANTLQAKRKRLAAAWRGVRGTPPTAGGTTPNDPDITALVAEPYSSVDEAQHGLAELLDAFERRDDRRAVFLTIYSRVTGEIADRIARGDFTDTEWVATYLVAFANYYRRAVYDYEIGNLERLADPWQIAFETAARADALVVQDAILGINAHINYDLAYALDQVGVDPNRPAKYEDHRAVTDVLRTLVDDTQAVLAENYAPGIETLDEGLGRVDERAAVFTIHQCRESAWRNANAMNSRLGIRRRLARWITDATSTGIAYLVLSSRASVAVHDELRELEGDPPDSTESTADPPP